MIATKWFLIGLRQEYLGTTTAVEDMQMIDVIA